MNFFEYLYCRLYWWNTEVIKEKEMPVYYSIMGISVFHGFSILPIFLTFNLQIDGGCLNNGKMMILV